MKRISQTIKDLIKSDIVGVLLVVVVVFLVGSQLHAYLVKRRIPPQEKKEMIAACVDEWQQRAFQDCTARPSLTPENCRKLWQKEQRKAVEDLCSF